MTLKQLKIIAFVLFLLLLISIFFIFNGHRSLSIDRDQVKNLQFQRDSIITYNIAESKKRESFHKQVTDSLINYNQYYVKADSINQIIIYNEKRKLTLLTRAGRDRVRDSIFSANHLPNSPR